jgi:hypothetical protein
LIMGVATTLLAKHIQSTTDIVSNPPWSRPLIAADALTFYLSKLIVPVSLSFDYGRSPQALFKDATLHYSLYWTWIVPVVLAIVITWAHRPKLTLAALIFLLGVLPVLGFVPFQFQYNSTVADRYVYISMLGIAIVVGMFLSMLPEMPAATVGAVGLIVLAILTFRQAGIWNDTDTLYTSGMNPNWPSPMHWFVLGQYRDKQSEFWDKLAQKTADAGDIATAGSQAAIGRERRGVAIDAYEIANNLDPTFAIVYQNLTVDLLRAQRLQDAIKLTQRRIEMQPKFPPEVRDKPAALHGTLGMLLFDAHLYEQAAKELQESLKYEPNERVKQRLEEAQQYLGDSTEPSTEPSTDPS